MLSTTNYVAPLDTKVNEYLYLFYFTEKAIKEYIMQWYPSPYKPTRFDTILKFGLRY